MRNGSGTLLHIVTLSQNCCQRGIGMPNSDFSWIGTLTGCIFEDPILR